jgi:hypothetical protein
VGIDRVLQPFQKAFTPIGATTATPRSIDLYEMKIDLQETPDDIADSWLAFLEGDGIDRAQWPYIRWWLTEHVIPRANEDYENNEVYGGVYAAPTPNTAGAAGTAVNGLAKQITDNAALVNTITMGAIPGTAADFCSYVEEWFANIGEVAGINGKLYRKAIDKVFMSETLHLLYRQGKRDKYNQNYAQDTDLDKLIDFPGTMVVGLPSMEGASKLIATLPNNRRRYIKRSPISSFKVGEYSPRQVSVYTDWWETCTFMRMQDVFVNELT